MTKLESNRLYDRHMSVVLLSLIVAALNACLLSPLYIQVENNISYEYTVVPIVLEYSILLFDTIYISLLFAVLTFTVYAINKGIVNKYLSLISICSVVCLKHILNLAVSSIIDGHIELSFDIPMTLYSIAIDLIILSIVALIANKKAKKHFAHAKAMTKASKYIKSIEYTEADEIYPFKGFLKIKAHPILLPVFIGAAVTSALLVAQRLYADFVVLGAPTSYFEIIDIVFSYTTDILTGLLSYTVAYFSVSYVFINYKNYITD